MDCEQFEQKYVHEIYEKIASHFSETRYKRWPRVEQFVNSLEIGSILIDVGCGNGKYLGVNKDKIWSIGCDRSSQLIRICHEREYQVIRSDCLACGIRNGVADAVICIAVLHHLASAERRFNLLKSLIDLVSIGGRVLVYVWAFEQKINGKSSKYLKSTKEEIDQQQNKQNVYHEINGHEFAVHQNRTEFKEQDMLVQWKNRDQKTQDDNSNPSLRFYHLFVEGELEELVMKLNGVKLIQSYYDNGNWCAVIQRLS